MTPYTGFQYICIDIANQYGHDKWLFDDRIKWVLDNIDHLETMKGDEKNYPLYMKAVQALRKAQRGEATGHLVGLDACCSGMQIMSALTGCVEGSKATNLVNTGLRQDAYTNVTTAAGAYLGEGLVISRADIKQAVMTCLYGSKAIPKALFGEDTAELRAFYAAMQDICPGAFELLQDLLASWQSYTLAHQWVLPDNFHAFVKVMEKVEKRIEVDELDHATFTYEFGVNCGTKSDVKNAANVIHSIDAYVLRTLRRLCSYDRAKVTRALSCIMAEIHMRIEGEAHQEAFEEADMEHRVYARRYEETKMADPVILPFLQDGDQVAELSMDHLIGLREMARSMLVYQPFEIVTVHDEFKAHANNMNHVRSQYIEIFARMAESNMLNDIFKQITGHEVAYAIRDENLGKMIRESEYALS